MKRLLLFPFLLISLSLIFAQEKSITFKELLNDLDASKLTRLAVKNNWLQVKGKTVTWTAEVVDVQGGRGKAQITAVHKAGKTYKGYNLVLNTYEIDDAAKLKKGQTFTFSGTLHKYKSKSSGLLIVYLTEVVLQ